MKGCRPGYALTEQAGLCAAKAGRAMPSRNRKGYVPLEQGAWVEAGNGAFYGLHHQATRLTQ